MNATLKTRMLSGAFLAAGLLGPMTAEAGPRDRRHDGPDVRGHVTIDLGRGGHFGGGRVVRTETVLVEPGHWEWRTQRVLVEAGHWEWRHVPAVTRRVYDGRGRTVTVVIAPARQERVWVPDRYELRQVRVWIPPRYETRQVVIERPRPVIYGQIGRGGITIGGVFRF